MKTCFPSEGFQAEINVRLDVPQVYSLCGQAEAGSCKLFPDTPTGTKFTKRPEKFHVAVPPRGGRGRLRANVLLVKHQQPRHLHSLWPAKQLRVTHLWSADPEGVV